MKNPVLVLGDRLAEKTSRSGFFAKMGTLALAGGALVAGLGQKEAYAACGTCFSPCCGVGYTQCPPGTFEKFLGCCRLGNNYYTSYECDQWLNGPLVCYIDVPSQGCPQVPQHP